MGGQHSRTRKITFENEDPKSVITLSDEMVGRLKGSEAVRSVVSGAPRQPPPQGFDAGVQQPIFYEPSLTSLQIRQANLEEMKKNDAYWEKRIQDLQNCHTKIQEIMDCEYNKAITEVTGDRSDCHKLSKTPCITNRAAVLACYKKYPNEPMRCAKEVAAFTQCVDMTRAAVVEARS